MINLQFKKTRPDAKAPTYATEGAACFDLYSTLWHTLDKDQPFVVVDTGIAVDIPDGWCMKVFSRSGHGFNYSVRLANSVGIIDSDFVGSIKVKLALDDPDKELIICTGDRIAQAMLVPVERCEFVEVEELKETQRGAGGFGSTGA